MPEQQPNPQIDVNVNDARQSKTPADNGRVIFVPAYEGEDRRTDGLKAIAVRWVFRQDFSSVLLVCVLGFLGYICWVGFPALLGYHQKFVEAAQQKDIEHMAQLEKMNERMRESADAQSKALNNIVVTFQGQQEQMLQRHLGMMKAQGELQQAAMDLKTAAKELKGAATEQKAAAKSSE